jgi:hypothetical protein
MGPITLFDKSFLQSLSLDESVFFDHFFLPVICPLFYVETLADLEKSIRQGRTPEQEVGIIADKIPDMNGAPCAYHADLATANLFGANIPLDGRIPRAGGRRVKDNGKVGVVFPEAPEAEAFTRWQQREFLYVERQFARVWRTTLNAIDLASIATEMKAMGINPQTCRSVQDAKHLVDKSLERRGSTAAHQITLALRMLDVPQEYASRVTQRWRFLGRPPLVTLAPYASYMLAVELFFQVALGADLISTTDANNRTDIGYLFYLPFCHLFVSSDHLHKRCAPEFLRRDQSFVWGPDLKKDLHRLMAIYAERPEQEKEQGLIRLAPTPPKDDRESLVVQLWDRHLHDSWRTSSVRAPSRNAQEDSELIEHINRLTLAPSLTENEAHIDPASANFVHLQRRVLKRKGNWWQLPKDLKG